MHGPGYVILWVILLLVLLAAGWRRRWWPLAIYALGCLILLVEVNRGNGGWEDLAEFATLIVFVLPLYLIGSIVWLILYLVERKRKLKN
ncbi:hypothetical protein [Paenibacillus sacheonensis]|uniref:Uncharacterized protein n=1 Tax=Paenibacillus sacheonensis TaxID=742054 RepID=A0A7X4YMF1_9BACL|nr:hypothetical protein [Paenibacillus sacheonensis]MBM7563166.1 hypothetical protein [Paenibacillus sacheonensis]NBC68271.1 hypothetical protein [Paenibacillus sacheonensis]